MIENLFRNSLISIPKKPKVSLLNWMDFPDHNYRQMCSAATLQSAKEGFFRYFVDSVREKTGSDWIDHVFAKQDLEKDKIRAIFNEKKVWNAVNETMQNVKKLFREKSAKASEDARLEGDKQLEEGNFNKAVLFYSQSVVRAPSHKGDKSVGDNLTLALAYKSRATAFFKLKRFEECLTDLHLTLEEGYPVPLKYQVYRQMGECYKALKQVPKTKISFQVTLKLLEEQILRLETTTLQHGSKKGKSKDIKLKEILEKEREELKKLLQSLSKEVPDVEEEIGPPEILWSSGVLPKLSGEPNEKHPSASNLVTIKHTLEEGRFAAAAGNIDAGDTLVVEEPQAAILIPKMLSSHCHHCFVRLIAPIPCKTCSGLAFCSVKCRNEAESYHQYECQLLGLLIGSGMSVLSFLSLRMITQEGFEFFKKLQAKIEKMKADRNAPDFNEREAQYIRVYNLITHSSMRLNEDFFQRSLMAIFLVRCLKETSFFGASVAKKDVLSEDEILTASLILRHLQLLQFNAHEIYETKVSEVMKTRGSKTNYIGVGIYPTVSLFNHECTPSVTRYFSQKSMIIKSVRPLGKDEVISENYGPIFTKRTLTERVRDLTSRYWFKCRCKACLEDWPTLEFLTKENMKLRCTTFKCKQVFDYPSTTKRSATHPRCPLCLNEIDLLDVIRRVNQVTALFDKGIAHMDSKRFDKAIPLFLAFLDKIFTLVTPPCKEISLCQEALRTCYAQTGNIWVVDTSFC